MKLNPLAHEILSYGRIDDADDFPAVPGLPVPRPGDSEPADPFGELFEYQPATGRSNDLAKRAELTQLTDDVLGEGTADLFSTPAESPLEKRLTEISRKAAVGIEKAVSIAVAAPTRKGAISAILNKAKQQLINKGFSAGVARFGADGWGQLQANCEAFVTECLMRV
ncbi:MAG: hypothetical protein WBQ46_08060 [Terriglobales bacterium]